MFVESNSTAPIIPQTNFEAIILKDVRGERFQAKTHTSRQILDSGRYNLLSVAPVVMILVFLQRGFQKHILFTLYDLQFLNNDTISKMCHNAPNLSEPPPSPFKDSSRNKPTVVFLKVRQLYRKVTRF